MPRSDQALFTVDSDDDVPPCELIYYVEGLVRAVTTAYQYVLAGQREAEVRRDCNESVDVARFTLQTLQLFDNLLLEASSRCRLNHRDQKLPASLLTEKMLLLFPPLALQKSKSVFPVQNVQKRTDVRVCQMRHG